MSSLSICTHSFGNVIHHQDFPYHHLLVTHNSDLHPRLGWPVVHLSPQQITNLVHVKWNLESFFRPDLPVLQSFSAAYTAPNSSHRGLVLGSCIPCPIASNSPELELDLTAEKQQELIISYSKDYCKWPRPEQTPPSFPPHAFSCPLLLTSKYDLSWTSPILINPTTRRLGKRRQSSVSIALGVRTANIHEERLLTLLLGKRGNGFQSDGRLYNRGQWIFSVKGQIINIIGFPGHPVSVPNAQHDHLWHESGHRQWQMRHTWMSKAVFQ